MKRTGRHIISSRGSLSLAIALFAAIVALGAPALARAGTHSGSISNTDPTITDQRILRNEPPSTCAAPTPFPGKTGAVGGYHYDQWTFANSTNSPVCVTVNFDALTCTTSGYLNVTAYLNSFNPADISQNYLADVGGSPDPAKSFSFTVPAQTRFVIVVNEVDPGGGCAGYSFSEDTPSGSGQNLTLVAVPGAGTNGPASPYPSNIDVSGISGVVGKVTVTLHGLSHTWPDDIDVLLTAPNGQTLLLMSDAGGSSDVSNVNLTFDDAAASQLPDAALLTSGIFSPSNYEVPVDGFDAPAPAGPYGATLGSLVGGNPNGTWSLYVMDDTGGDIGTLGGWSLTVQPAPETTITAGPSALTNDSTPTFVFTSSAASAGFQCSIDGASFAGCSSPVTTGALPDGGHTFTVRSTDGFGITDPTPASQAFTVDTVAPNTTIGSGPPASTTLRSAAFTFSSEAGATFRCKLDAGVFAVCSSPKGYAGFRVGVHTFSVAAVDGAGNVDASPALRTWRVALPKCIVPKVVGKRLKIAKARIKKAHCRVGKITSKISTSKKKGRVLAQKPKPGKKLTNGARVNLTVGKGPRRR